MYMLNVYSRFASECLENGPPAVARLKKSRISTLDPDDQIWTYKLVAVCTLMLGS